MPFEGLALSLAAPAAMIAIAAFKGLVLFGIAAIAARLLRRAPATTRYAVWATALGGQLLLLIGGAILPPIEVPDVPLTWSVTIGRGARLAEPGKEKVSPSPAAVARSSSLRAAPSGTNGSNNIGTNSSAGSIHFSLGALFSVVWIVGALVLLARYAVGTLGVARLARESEHVDDGRWLSLLTQTATRMRIRRPLTLLRSNALDVPVTWGILYPVILLPREAGDWNDERRRFVLVHEMAHVKRFDAIVQIITQLAIIVFWFSPAVWYAAQRIRIEREHACDDEVLLYGTRPSFYASELLAMVQCLGHRGDKAPAFAALAMARRTEFEGRMLAILDAKIQRSISYGRSSLATAILALVLVLPLAALHPAPRSLSSARGLALPPVVVEAPASNLASQIVLGALLSVDSTDARSSVRAHAAPASAEERMRAILARASTFPAADKGPLLYDATSHVAGNRDLERRFLAVARGVDQEHLAALLIRAIRAWPQDEATTLDLLAVADLISEERGRIAVLLEMQNQGMIHSERTKQSYFKVASALTGQSYRAVVRELLR